MQNRTHWGGLGLSAMTILLGLLGNPGCTNLPSLTGPGTGPGTSPGTTASSAPSLFSSPTPKPSPKGSASPQATASIAPSASPSISPSPAVSPSAEPPASPSPASSPTPGPSPSPSALVSPIPSPSPSHAASPTPSPTAHPSALPSSSPSPAPSPTPSPTAPGVVPTGVTLDPPSGELNAQAPGGGADPGFVWRVPIHATVTYSDGSVDSDVHWVSSSLTLGTYHLGYVEAAVDAPGGVLSLTAISNRDARFSARANFTITTYGNAEVTVD